MARQLRIQAAGLTYHVWARGTGRMAIYLDDHDREQFLALLERTLIRHHVDCHAYCLMRNHYHLVITTNEPNLSRAIQQVNGPYGQWWDYRHSRPGHVFQGRFGAQVVEDEAYLLTACRYVVLNPVRAGFAAFPGEWKWSSYRATAGMEAGPSWLRRSRLWRCLGSEDAETATALYRAFVETGLDATGGLPRELVLGRPDFVQRFNDQRQSASAEVPRQIRQVRVPLQGHFATAFTQAQRATAAAAAYQGGYSQPEIAQFLGLHYATVSKMVRRGQTLAKSSRARYDPT